MMEQLTPTLPTVKYLTAQRILAGTAAVWFAVALIGQLLFAAHIANFYGGTSLSGQTQQWNEILFHGLISGDWVGNLMLISHLIMAFVITLGGPLQLIPALRKRAMGLHRWNGRIYLLVALLISLAGLYLVLSRGVVGGTYMAMGNIINASLIITCAIMTWRTVMAGRIHAHQQWAIRTYLMVSGVWFFRIGFGLWILVNGGTAPGHTSSFDGPFDIFLALGHSLVPLLFVELYFWVKKAHKPALSYGYAAGLALLTAGMAGGIFMAHMIFWQPHFG